MYAMTQFIGRILLLPLSLFSGGDVKKLPNMNDTAAVTMLKIDNTENCSVCCSTIIDEALDKKNIKKDNIIEERKGFGVTFLTCGHIFHVNCITPWFKEKGTCPNCVGEVVQYQSLEQLRIQNKKLTDEKQSFEQALQKSRAELATLKQDMPIPWQRFFIPGVCSLCMFVNKYGDFSSLLRKDKLLLGTGIIAACCYISAQPKNIISFRAANYKKSFFKRFFTTNRMEEIIYLTSIGLVLHSDKCATRKDVLGGIVQSAIIATGVTAINTVFDPYMCKFDEENRVCDLRSLAGFLAVQIPYAKMAALLIKK